MLGRGSQQTMSPTIKKWSRPPPATPPWNWPSAPNWPATSRSRPTCPAGCRSGQPPHYPPNNTCPPTAAAANQQQARHVPRRHHVPAQVIGFEGSGRDGVVEDHGLPLTPHWHRPVGAVLAHFDLDQVTLTGISLGGGLAIPRRRQRAPGHPGHPGHRRRRPHRRPRGEPAAGATHRPDHAGGPRAPTARRIRQPADTSRSTHQSGHHPRTRECSGCPPRTSTSQLSMRCRRTGTPGSPHDPTYYPQ